MGFPIRRSTGRRLFAPHRSLSQRTTSFIASCRQGIHRMLLGRLIALISNAHPLSENPPGLRQAVVRARLGQTPPRKTSLHRDRPAPSLRLASSGRQTSHALTRGDILRRRRTGGSGAWGISLLHDVKQPAALAQRKRNSSTLDIASPIMAAT